MLGHPCRSQDDCLTQSSATAGSPSSVVVVRPYCPWGQVLPLSPNLHLRLTRQQVVQILRVPFPQNDRIVLRPRNARWRGGMQTELVPQTDPIIVALLLRHRQRLARFGIDEIASQA